MNALESLKRKYGGSIDSVLNQRKKINNEIKSLRDSNKLKHEIIKEIEVKEKMYSSKALSLHKKRESKSIELSKMIVMTMSNLNMDGARFDIKIEQDEIEESYIKLDGKNVAGTQKVLIKLSFIFLQTLVNHQNHYRLLPPAVRFLE